MITGFFLKCFVYVCYAMDTVGITPRGLRVAAMIGVAIVVGVMIGRHI